MDAFVKVGFEQIVDDLARELFVLRQSLVDLGQKSAVAEA